MVKKTKPRLYIGLSFLLLIGCAKNLKETNSLKGNCVSSAGNKPISTSYEDLFELTVNIATARKNPDYEEIDRFFATNRHNIARFLDHKNAQFFGKTRNPMLMENPLKETMSYTTPFIEGSPYSGALDRLKIIFNGEIEETYGLVEGGSFGKYRIYEITAKDPLDPKGDQFTLTSYAGYLDSNNILRNMNFARSTENPTDSISRLNAIHTSNTQLTELNVILEGLFKKALGAENVDDIWKSMGQFHWWYANAMPYKRGSASIAKMHIAYLLNHHAKTIGKVSIDRLHKFPKIHGIDIDVLAMTLGDPEVFANYYKKAILSDKPLKGTPMGLP